LHAAGVKKSKAGDDEAAIASYRQALALDPNRSETLYNLGLIFKYRGGLAGIARLAIRGRTHFSLDTTVDLRLPRRFGREWAGAARRLAAARITIPAVRGAIEDQRGRCSVRPRIAIERFPPGAAILEDQPQVVERFRPVRIESQCLTVAGDGRLVVARF